MNVKKRSGYSFEEKMHILEFIQQHGASNQSYIKIAEELSSEFTPRTPDGVRMQWYKLYQNSKNTD